MTVVDYSHLPIQRYAMAGFQRRVLALRDNFTACEAFSVALAEALGEPLLTDDRKFQRAPVHSAVIETW